MSVELATEHSLVVGGCSDFVCMSEYDIGYHLCLIHCATVTVQV